MPKESAHWVRSSVLMRQWQWAAICSRPQLTVTLQEFEPVGHVPLPVMQVPFRHLPPGQAQELVDRGRGLHHELIGCRPRVGHLE